MMYSKIILPSVLLLGICLFIAPVTYQEIHTSVISDKYVEVNDILIPVVAHLKVPDFSRYNAVYIIVFVNGENITVERDIFNHVFKGMTLNYTLNTTR